MSLRIKRPGLRMTLLRPIILTSILLALGGMSFAQVETGQIIGRITDPSGAVVAGATAKVTSIDTGAVVTGMSDANGTITVPNLKPGLYEVTVQATGFADATKRVQVTVGSQVSVDIALSVQATTEVVTVVGSQGVEVNTENQQLSDVVAENQLLTLPTLTRNPYDLVGLSPNVSPGNEMDTGPTSRGVGFSINGQRSASTNVLLDGGENNDEFTASLGQSVPLDSVKEFRVITSDFSPEYGRAGGGIVNVATKSGTNSFHGTAYEFNRISALASNDFLNNANNVPKGVFTRNQFGYSLGGPIIKDKLFFFSSSEWIRVRSNEDFIALVPTPQLLATSAANTQEFFNAFPLKSPINGTVFTAGQLGLTSLPAGFPAFGQVLFPVPIDIGAGLPQNTVETVGRIDYTYSQNTSLYGRYALEKSVFPPGTNAFSPFQGFDTGINTLNQNFLFSATHTWSPKLVTTFKAVYNRLNNLQPLGQQPPVPTLYMRSTETLLAGFPVAMPGYLPFNPGTAIPFGGPQNLGQFYGDGTYVAGNHQFKFGGTFIHIQDNRSFGAYETAVETLGTSVDQAVSNLAAGDLHQFQAAVNPQGKFPGQTITLPTQPPDFNRSNRYNEFAFYFNDDWKIFPRFSLNLGLRYDYFGVQHNENPNLDSNFYFGSGSSFFQQIRNGR